MKGSLSRRWLWGLLGPFLIGWYFTLGTPELWATQTDQLDKDINERKRI